MIYSRFDDIPFKEYRVMLIDQPWLMSIGKKSLPQHYPRMTFDEAVA